jgi:phage regulator Rha-like protein
MANNIDKKEPVAICDQSKIDIIKCDNHELAGNIEPLIKVIRGQQVMLDRDLATLYGVETKRLNEQVKRNIKRFPEDFMFQLTKDECLRSQIATLNEGRGQHLKYMPYVFTENGVAMLSSVLRSDTAIEVNIRIMRAFTSMRHFLQNNAEVFQRLSTMEYHQLEMQQHLQESDKRIEEVFRRLDEGNAKKVCSTMGKFMMPTLSCPT